MINLTDQESVKLMDTLKTISSKVDELRVERDFLKFELEAQESKHLKKIMDCRFLIARWLVFSDNPDPETHRRSIQFFDERVLNETGAPTNTIVNRKPRK